MATFRYTALNKKDAYAKGVIESMSERSARNQLEKEGFMIVNLKKEKNESFSKLNNIIQSVSRVDRIFFTRHLYTMLESGISLDKAIRIISEQTANKKFKEILEDVHAKLQSGQALHYALSHHKKVFSNFFISLVRVGEKSGKLDEVLAYALEQQESDYELLTRARSAMVYPLVVLSALVIVVIFMMTFVVPRITEVLIQYNVKLPVATRIVIGLSNFLMHYGLYLVPGLILLGYLFRKWQTSRRGKRQWDSFILKIPRLKILIREFNLARLTRALSALLKSGMQIDNAMNLAAEVSNNSQYTDSLKDSIKFIQKGIPISETMRGYPKLYPTITSQMVSVGEKTGKLDYMLARLAAFYEKSVTTAMGNMASIIEPVLLISIGFTVAFMALAILTPIWKYADTV
ncbi:MAG: type II secretion system F family protein [Patescibacteria group bacterium]|jgi:type II secretory pathway component PulF